MKTDIEYLTVLEKDLRRAAIREELRAEGRGRRGGGRKPRRWAAWSAAAAAFLVVAFVIGSALQGGNGRFALVGGSDDGSGPVPANVPPDGGDVVVRDEGFAFDPDAGGEEVPVAQPSPAPAQGGNPPASQDLSKIVRDGAISVEVPNEEFGDTFRQVIGIAEAAGGTVMSSTTEGGDSGTLTLRIPASEFDSVLLAVGDLGTVTSSTTKGQDVTAEYIDLQARLKILRTKRDFYFDLFENATTVNQSIQMENRLEDVQLEIERLEGQIRYIDDQVALSTLKVSLREKDAPEAEQEEDLSNPSIGRAWELAWQGTLRVVSTVVVGLGYLVPIAILAGIVLAVVMLVRRRGPGAS